MWNIIQYLCWYNQYLLKIISYLLNFIVQFIPLKQIVFDDATSQNYQKFKTDKLPIIKKFESWIFGFCLNTMCGSIESNLSLFLGELSKTYHKIPSAPLRCHLSLHLWQQWWKGRVLCKVCSQTFVSGEKVTSHLVFICPYCGHALHLKKTESILLFTSALIPNALITLLI